MHWVFVGDDILAGALHVL